MNSALKSSTALSATAGLTEPTPDTGLSIEHIPLPHLARELVQIVEPGQPIPGHRRLYHQIGLGELPMIVFIRNRWYCPRPELPALAQALGLRLKRRASPRTRSRTTRTAA